METIDTFDGSKPNLISSKMLKDIEAKLNVPDVSESGNKVVNGLGHFYTEYVAPNLFPLIVISLLVIYLTIKYVLKKDREERENAEDEKHRRIEKTTKHMLNIETDVLNDEKDGDKMKASVNNHDEQKSGNSQKKSDISSMISDEYLLTDEEDVEENPEPETQEDLMRWVMDRGSPYDIDRATKIIFGQD